MRNLIILILLCIIAASCASTDNPMSATTAYRMDMELIEGNRSAEGMMTLPRKAKYEIELTSPGRLDLLTLKTCSRDVAIEKAGGWIRKGRAKYIYVPNELEQRPACDLEIWGFDAKKGKHALGYIVFDNLDDRLPARVTCGESNKNYAGTSVCQGSVGTKQRIAFASSVWHTASEACLAGITIESESAFEIRISTGFCDYLFLSKTTGEVHRLVTYGFEQTMVRE